MAGKVLIYILALSFLLSLIGVVMSRNITFHLTILYSGEELGELEPCGCSKGMLGGITRRDTLISSIRKAHPHLLILSTGNIISQPTRQSEMKYQIAMTAMKHMGYDAINLGDKDLLLGIDLLSQIGQNLNAPLICANLMTKKGDRRQEAGGRKQEREIFEPYKVVNIDGLKVGIIGVISKGEERGDRREKSGLQGKLIQPEKAIGEMMEEIEDKVDLFVLLGCMDMEEAERIQKKFSSLNLILISSGGEKPTIRMDSNSKALIGDVGVKGRYLGKVEMRLKRDGEHLELLDLKHEFIPLGEDIPKSDEMVQLMGIYQMMVEEEDLAGKVERRKHQGGRFVGGDVCGGCHEEAYSIWRESSHSRAYEALVRRGRERDPECLICHSVGFGYEGGFSGGLEKGLIGVGCESCHGAGEDHLRSPRERKMHLDVNCRSCHTADKSPKFNYEGYLDKIRH